MEEKWEDAKQEEERSGYLEDKYEEIDKNVEVEEARQSGRPSASETDEWSSTSCSSRQRAFFSRTMQRPERNDWWQAGAEQRCPVQRAARTHGGATLRQAGTEEDNGAAMEWNDRLERVG